MARARRRSPDARSGRRRVTLRAAPLVLAVVTAACVTYDVESEPVIDPAVVAQPLAIPIGAPAGQSPNARAVDAYYVSVVSQLQDALLERDPELLGALIAMHDRAGAPDWARERIAQFRWLVRGLRFELHAEAATTLELSGETPALGEAMAFRLRLGEAGEPGITVPGLDRGDAHARVLVSVVVQDEDCYGGRTRREFSEILPVEHTVRFDDGDELDLPFGLPELAPEGCYREVDVTCDLLPGQVLVDGEVVPGQRARLGRVRVPLFPRGIDSVRENPYTHLSRALELGDPKHFDNVFLAARLMDDGFRDDAVRKLIQRLRVGRADVGRVCMAALRELTGEPISVEDRDGWLQWWRRQQSRPGDGDSR